MSFRRPLCAACLAAFVLAPLPALAREKATDDVAKRLSDPATQAGVAVALTAFSEALLDLKIEPFRRALEAAGSDGAADLPPDARLRDIAPHSDKLTGEIGRRVPETMGAAAGMAGAVEDMLPELRATIDRMKDAIPKH